MLRSETDYERAPIEVAEIVGFGLVAAALLIVITEVGTAVMAAFSSPGIPSGSFIGVAAIPGPSAAETLARATARASPFFPVLLLGALAASWWQFQSWTGVIDDSDDSDDSDDETLTTAFARLLRARALSDATLILMGVTIAAVIGDVVATVITNSTEGTGIVVLSGYLEVIGIGLATILIACAGIWAGLHIRNSVNETFAEAEIGDFEDDLEDVGPPPGT
jgi:Flp pilus assembly pilin Flp